MRKVFLLVVLALALLLTGCSRGQQNVTTLTDQDSGKSVSLTAGDLLMLRLSSNPTTGYRWALKSVDQDILSQNGKPAYLPGNGRRVGAGGTEIWRFVAEKPGETTLTMIYARSWEKKVAPAKTFTLHVTVVKKK